MKKLSINVSYCTLISCNLSLSFRTWATILNAEDICKDAMGDQPCWAIIRCMACLHSDLQPHGVFCWSAPYDDGYEEKYTRLDVPIFLSDILLLVISEHSRTEASHRALNSIMKEALVKERRGFTPFLLPIHLDKDPQQTRGVWPRVLRSAPSQGRDFSHWKDQHLYQEALQHLLRDLRVS